MHPTVWMESGNFSDAQRYVIQHFKQRRIESIPMCPEKLCCVTPLRISGIDPTLIHPIDSGRSESDRSDPDRSDPDRSDPDRSDPDRSDPGQSDPDRFDPDRFDPGRSDLDQSDPERSDRI